ncbi:hypothetical protein TNCV_2859211 [Trichonephila clavipes]|nr:hypothetical protein TNCV_2859211 [Trichonephila clavipes]
MKKERREREEIYSRRERCLFFILVGLSFWERQMEELFPPSTGVVSTSREIETGPSDTIKCDIKLHLTQWMREFEMAKENSGLKKTLVHILVERGGSLNKQALNHSLLALLFRVESGKSLNV